MCVYIHAHVYAHGSVINILRVPLPVVARVCRSQSFCGSSFNCQLLPIAPKCMSFCTAPNLTTSILTHSHLWVSRVSQRHTTHSHLRHPIYSLEQGESADGREGGGVEGLCKDRDSLLKTVTPCLQKKIQKKMSILLDLEL